MIENAHDTALLRNELTMDCANNASCTSMLLGTALTMNAIANEDTQED